VLERELRTSAVASTVILNREEASLLSVGPSVFDGNV
jgi:hypothetical protein